MINNGYRKNLNVKTDHMKNTSSFLYAEVTFAKVKKNTQNIFNKIEKERQAI